MVVVDVDSSGRPASEELRRAAAGPWELATHASSQYEGLLAIRDGRIVGAYRVLALTLLADGRVHFELIRSSRFAFMVGRPAPERDLAGGRGPELVDTGLLIYPRRNLDELTALRLRRHGHDRGPRVMQRRLDAGERLG